MAVFFFIALAGLIAQIVDGGLGMGFGVTSTSMLILMAGLAPAQASAVVHAVQLGTTAVSGWSHYRFGNVKWGVALRLGIPGAIGALLGSLVLSHISLALATPITSTLLVIIGMNLLWRFSLRRIVWKCTKSCQRGKRGGEGKEALSQEDTSASHSIVSQAEKPQSVLRKIGLYGLGFTGGFVDSTGGGGWGPVVTSTLLTLTKREPRKVIGTVNAAEFLVTCAATVGFTIGMWPEIVSNASYIVVLLIGGTIGAPLGAWLVTKVNPTILGGLVGTVIVVTNLSRLSDSTAIHVVQLVVTVLGVGLTLYGAKVRRKPSVYSSEPVRDTHFEAVSS